MTKAKTKINSLKKLVSYKDNFGYYGHELRTAKTDRVVLEIAKQKKIPDVTLGTILASSQARHAMDVLYGSKRVKSVLTKHLFYRSALRVV